MTADGLQMNDVTCMIRSMTDCSMSLIDELSKDFKDIADRWGFSNATRADMSKAFLDGSWGTPGEVLAEMQKIVDEQFMNDAHSCDTEEKQRDRSDRLEQLQKTLSKTASFNTVRLPVDLAKPYADKLQITIPPAFGALLDGWAAAEGRDKTSVAVAAMEVGLRQLLKDGSLPPLSVEFYKRTCETQTAMTLAKTAAVQRTQALDEMPL